MIFELSNFSWVNSQRRFSFEFSVGKKTLGTLRTVKSPKFHKMADWFGVGIKTMYREHHSIQKLKSASRVLTQVNCRTWIKRSRRDMCCWVLGIPKCKGRPRVVSFNLLISCYISLPQGLRFGQNKPGNKHVWHILLGFIDMICLVERCLMGTFSTRKETNSTWQATGDWGRWGHRLVQILSRHFCDLRWCAGMAHWWIGHSQQKSLGINKYPQQTEHHKPWERLSQLLKVHNWFMVSEESSGRSGDALRRPFSNESVLMVDEPAKVNGTFRVTAFELPFGLNKVMDW